MAKIDQYRRLIQDILQEHSEFKSSNEDVEAQLIFEIHYGAGNWLSAACVTYS